MRGGCFLVAKTLKAVTIFDKYMPLDMHKILLEVGFANVLADMLGKEQFKTREDLSYILSTRNQQVLAAIDVARLNGGRIHSYELSNILSSGRVPTDTIASSLSRGWITNRLIDTEFISREDRPYRFTEKGEKRLVALKDYWREMAFRRGYSGYFRNLRAYLTQSGIAAGQKG